VTLVPELSGAASAAPAVVSSSARAAARAWSFRAIRIKFPLFRN
jgi:hypothetical protein